MPNASEVERIVKDCLYRQEEIVDGSMPDGCVVAEGVLAKFGFNPDRLSTHKDEIRAALDELPKEFRVDGGGGYSFLNMPVDRDGRQWGEQRDADHLLTLGIASGYARILIPRELWSVFPGGVPYVQIGDPSKEAVDPLSAAP